MRQGPLRWLLQLVFLLSAIAGSSPLAVASEDPPAGPTTSPVVETVHLIFVDFSSSMSGERHAEAMQLLDRSATSWGNGRTDLVLATAFAKDHVVGVQGHGPARDLAVRALAGRAVAVDTPADLLTWLRTVPTIGTTRLFDTILDVLPAVESFPAADLTIEIVSDGADNESRATEEDVVRRLGDLLCRKASEHRAVDVVLRRYERANQGLADALRQVAASSGGYVRVRDQDLDAAAAPCLEIPGAAIGLNETGDGRTLVSDPIAVFLAGLPGAAPVSVDVLAAQGVATVSWEPLFLADGRNELRLFVVPGDGFDGDFWSDVDLDVLVRVSAADAASADVRAGARIEAGWKAHRSGIALGLGALALLPLAAGAFSVLRSRSRRRISVGDVTGDQDSSQ